MRSDFARRRVKLALDRVGQSMVFRRSTSTGGPHPELNPPTISGLVLDGAHLTGAAVMNLKATSISGFLAAGDKIVLGVGPETYTAQAQVLSSNNHFTGISISPVLSANYADGIPVSLVFTADVPLKARIADFSNAVIDGTLIQQGDLNLVVPAVSLPWVPINTDKVLIFGKTRTIIMVKPNYTEDEIAFYSIQVR